jgi:hypothetical protein
MRWREPAYAREGLLGVIRRDARNVGLDPDLEEVNRVGRRGVVFAVADAAARADPLNVAGLHGGTRPQAVLMLQSARDHVRNDLHVSVGVRAKPLARAHPVLIDHEERLEAHMAGVVVAGEGEGVVGIEPAVIGVAPLFRFSDDDGGHGSAFLVVDASRIGAHSLTCQVPAWIE